MAGGGGGYLKKSIASRRTQDRTGSVSKHHGTECRLTPGLWDLIPSPGLMSETGNPRQNRRDAESISKQTAPARLALYTRSKKQPLPIIKARKRGVYHTLTRDFAASPPVGRDYSAVAFRLLWCKIVPTKHERQENKGMIRYPRKNSSFQARRLREPSFPAPTKLPPPSHTGTALLRRIHKRTSCVGGSWGEPRSYSGGAT